MDFAIRPNRRESASAEKHANVIAAVREHHSKHPLSSLHQPKSLLSGLVYCGACGGPCTLRGQNRFVCSAHITNGSCANGRTMPRQALEERVLTGLKERMMAPEAAEAALRSYAEENNRLNREARAGMERDRVELAKVDKAIKEIVDIMEGGGYTRVLMDRLRELEAKQDELRQRIETAMHPLPDIHPNVAQIYRRKVARLADALHHPEDQREAAEAIRSLIERVTLIPGAKRGEMEITLHGEPGAMLA